MSADRPRCSIIDMAISKARKKGLDVDLKVLENCSYVDQCGSSGQCPRYEDLMENPKFKVVRLRSLPANPVDPRLRFYNRLKKWAEVNPEDIGKQPPQVLKQTDWF